MTLPSFSRRDILCIGLGGLLGSLLRSWTGAGFEGAFPVPTVFINILGAVALGILHVSRHRMRQDDRILYMVGFCGSFTTVSLFSHETVELVGDGTWHLAVANLLLPVAIAFLAVYWIVERWDIPSGEESQ